MAPKELPFDVYEQILKRLPVSAYSDEGPRTLAACLRANSILRTVASIATLWEPHYHVRYTVSLPASELSRREALGDDWKSLYSERARLDRQAIKTLDDIVMERDGRLERAREITSSVSFDVWNALAMEALSPVPEPFRRVCDRSDDGHVPRHAIPLRRCGLWAEVRDQEDNDAEILETAIACLSSYFAHPPMEISSSLDILSDLCRSYLADKNLPTNPIEFNHSEDKLCRISTSICDFLWEHGFRPAEYSRFNAFNTRFPHWFLTTHKDTIPISLVYIFVCVARRLGMKAAPVDFPARVLAVVSSSEPTVSDIIVDVFGSRSRTILSLQEDIPHLLMDAGITPPIVIEPASTASMLSRASRNILASFSYLPPTENILEADLHIAFYVGLTTALAPGLSPPIKEQLLANCKAAHEDEDEAAASVTLRSKLPTRIQHFVGMIFKHAMYEYIGYIYAWESSCMASEGWITTMGVDSLPRGRHQPFYHIPH
ncbi:YccV-like-domain-containing protein [Chiua virens]|nr:YccV-like-domain-containing protein [Chiua virens]